jgi:hypothetical protein
VSHPVLSVSELLDDFVRNEKGMMGMEKVEKVERVEESRSLSGW